MKTLCTRRTFLRRSACGAVGIGMAASRLGTAAQAAPSDTIHMGFIGLGPRGGGIMPGFAGQRDVTATALCDVNKRRLAAAAKRVGGKVNTYGDFRKLLEQKDLDAVVVATPPHWHGIMCVQAAKAGKDFYVEKPMTVYVGESQAIVRAARRYGRVTQAGTQIHAGANYRRVVEIVRSGVLGKINCVRTFLTMNIGQRGYGKPPDQPVPDWLDWDMWVGPGPMRPFNPLIVRGAGSGHCWFMDYSGGWIPGMAPHIIDLPIWALDLGLPTHVSCQGGRFHVDDIGDVPIVQEALLEYPGLTFTWMMNCMNSYGWDYQGRGGRARRLGVYFHGEHATLHSHYGVHTIVPEKDPNATLPLPGPSLPPGKSHHRDWMDCIKTREQPTCNVFYHHRVNMVCCLANLVLHLGRSVAFDPKTETIVGDPEATRLILPAYREPWTLG